LPVLRRFTGKLLIEQAVGKLKRFKRIALRCEKTAQNYGSFVALALGFILIKSVTHGLFSGRSFSRIPTSPCSALRSSISIRIATAVFVQSKPDGGTTA
jgi:hypothetical protein